MYEELLGEVIKVLDGFRKEERIYIVARFEPPKSIARLIPVYERLESELRNLNASIDLPVDYVYAHEVTAWYPFDRFLFNPRPSPQSVAIYRCIETRCTESDIAVYISYELRGALPSLQAGAVDLDEWRARRTETPPYIFIVDLPDSPGHEPRIRVLERATEEKIRKGVELIRELAARIRSGEYIEELRSIVMPCVSIAKYLP